MVIVIRLVSIIMYTFKKKKKKKEVYICWTSDHKSSEMDPSPKDVSRFEIYITYTTLQVD